MSPFLPVNSQTADLVSWNAAVTPSTGGYASVKLFPSWEKKRELTSILVNDVNCATELKWRQMNLADKIVFFLSCWLMYSVMDDAPGDLLGYDLKYAFHLTLTIFFIFFGGGGATLATTSFLPFTMFFFPCELAWLREIAAGCRRASLMVSGNYHCNS